MIKIKRNPCPNTLKTSKAKVKYNLPEVVKTLWDMQYGKCCYCEQQIPETGHSKTVEHFHPKSIFNFKTNEWENLLLACSDCNGKKSDKFPAILSDNEGSDKIIYLTTKTTDLKKKIKDGIPFLIDPSEPSINPEEHITFQVNQASTDYGNVLARNDSPIGHHTIEVVGLAELHYNRLRRRYHRNLMILHGNLLESIDIPDRDMTENLKTRWKLHLASSHPFAAYGREFARFYKLDENYGIKIPNI